MFELKVFSLAKVEPWPFVYLHLDVQDEIDVRHQLMMKLNLILKIKIIRNDHKEIREGLTMKIQRKVSFFLLFSSSISFRSRFMRSETSESEEMNETLDVLLLSNFKKHRYTINYISNRDLLRLYEARAFLLFSSFDFSVEELDHHRWLFCRSRAQELGAREQPVGANSVFQHSELMVNFSQKEKQTFLIKQKRISFRMSRRMPCPIECLKSLLSVKIE